MDKCERKKNIFPQESLCIPQVKMGKNYLLSAYCMQAQCEVLLCIRHRWENWPTEVKCHKKEMDGFGRPQQNKLSLSPGALPPARVLGAVGHWSVTLNEGWSKRATACNLCNLPSAFLIGFPLVLETALQVDTLTPPPEALLPGPCFGLIPLITQGSAHMSPPKEGHPDKPT